MVENKDKLTILGGYSLGGVEVRNVRYANKGQCITKAVIVPSPASVDSQQITIPIGTSEVPFIPKVHRISLAHVVNGGGSVEDRKLLKEHGILAVKPGEIPGRGREKWRAGF